MKLRPETVGDFLKNLKVPTLILTRKIAKSCKVVKQFDGQGPGFPLSTPSRPRVTATVRSESKNKLGLGFYTFSPS